MVDPANGVLTLHKKEDWCLRASMAHGKTASFLVPSTFEETQVSFSLSMQIIFPESFDTDLLVEPRHSDP